MPPTNEVDAAKLSRRLRKLYGSDSLAALESFAFPEELPPPKPEPVPDELAKYRDDPVGFATGILGIEQLTDDQKNILLALPGRVKLESGHNCGKSFCMAIMVLWWFYTRNPSAVICNAPSSRAVEDILWTEVRLMWQRAKRKDLLPNYFIGPKAPEMYHTPEHTAKGYTTSRGESFQGRHRENMLFIFDEDEGIDAVFWDTTGTMYRPDTGDAWVCACNPVTTTSRSFKESRARNPDGSPKFRLFRFSSLNHPNVIADLAGAPRPIPGAVTRGQVDTWITDWTTKISDPEDRQPGDVEWPPNSGQWFRPGPIFKARAQGIRPTEGVDAVWSVDAWDKASTPHLSLRDMWMRNYRITIGVDTALYGDDDTAFHVRSGGLSLHHEAHNGWDYKQSADRLKLLCRYWSNWYNTQAVDPRPPLRDVEVEVIIEADGGYGPGVWSHRGQYENWKLVTVGSKSEKFDVNGKPLYANVRSEMWMEAAKAARNGLIDVSRLPVEVRQRLEDQLLPVMYEGKPDGSVMVEPKADIKERMGRSPDDADAFLLSHFKPLDWNVFTVVKDENEW